ncbi:MAG TPA: cytochrome b562 [Bdellovibrio sp.]|nr:cytochrome b562 [Bdellovibrio sp.]
MKKLIIAALFTLPLFTHTFAFAAQEDQISAAASLKLNMKQIGKNLKAIVATVNDSSKNQDNAGLAQQAAEAFQAVYNQVPDVINEMPADQQPEAIKGFQQEIQKGIDLFTQLKDAFLNGDNAGAAQILKALSQLKQDGHDQYNP